MLDLKIVSTIIVFSWLQIVSSATTWLEMTDKWQCTNEGMYQLSEDVRTFCTKKYGILYKKVEPMKAGEVFGNPSFRAETISPRKGWFK